jgi:hypothetical protein
VCVHIYIYVCVFVLICVYIYIYIYICVCVCFNVCVFVLICVCIYIYVCVFVLMCVCVCVCMYVYAYVSSVYPSVCLSKCAVQPGSLYVTSLPPLPAVEPRYLGCLARSPVTVRTKRAVPPAGAVRLLTVGSLPLCQYEFQRKCQARIRSVCHLRAVRCQQCHIHRGVTADTVLIVGGDEHCEKDCHAPHVAG